VSLTFGPMDERGERRREGLSLLGVLALVLLVGPAVAILFLLADKRAFLVLLGALATVGFFVVLLRPERRE
jgi:hypothetical protein